MIRRYEERVNQRIDMNRPEGKTSCERPSLTGARFF